MEKIIKNANRIISISENTRLDLINILNIKPEKIDVIHHGFSKPLRRNNSNNYGRYVLYAGARRGYKNFGNLSEAFSSIAAKDKDLKLICVGHPFEKQEMEELKKLNISEKVYSVGVDEWALNNLYSNALAFVYPSLYEGFGMSVLEAFANNCPVCLSNTSSLPEVAGDAGVYFDPLDRASIIESIKKVIYDPGFSVTMVTKGQERLNNFSWTKCARQTFESYKKAIS